MKINQLFSALTIFIATLQITHCNKVNHHEIHCKSMTLKDQDWFKDSFLDSIMEIYKNKTMVFTIQNEEIILNNNQSHIMHELLNKEFPKEFQKYALQYQAKKFIYQGKPIAAILYKTNKQDLYIAHCFIKTEYQRQGIGKYILNSLQKMHPECTVFEVLTRQQNHVAMNFYTKMGFKVSNINVVEKYGYNPLKYMSFQKTITS